MYGNRGTEMDMKIQYWKHSRDKFLNQLNWSSAPMQPVLALLNLITTLPGFNQERAKKSWRTQVACNGFQIWQHLPT